MSVLFWWFNDGVTPVLIPNTEVKTISADGSPAWARVGSRQNKVLIHIKFLLRG